MTFPRPVAFLFLGFAILLLSWVRLAGQGDLDPSVANGALDGANNPQPSMKTINQVEPRIAINGANTPGTFSTTYDIHEPGSYYLTENLVGEMGKLGLVVHVPNVEIDLMGFSLIGSEDENPNTEPGILVEAPATGVVIHSGTVIRWAEGIVSDGSNLTVRKVQALDNSFDGLRAGAFSEVRGCQFRGNTGDGIDLGPNSKIIGVRASDNSYGIVVEGGSLVQNCVAEGNVNYGIRLNGPGSRTESCVASGNNVGIGVDADRCTVIGNTCSDNNAEGIRCGILAVTFYQHCVIDGNHVAKTTQRGIMVTGTNNLVIRNVVQDAASAFFIGPNNQVGTLVSGIDATGLSGSSGGNLDSTIGPWANFVR